MKNRNKKFLWLCLLGGFFIWPNFAQAAPSNIVFTEIMYDPAGSDMDKEWVEIYNSGAEPVALVEGTSPADSWRFFDGSNHTLTFVQGSLTIPPRGLAILASNAATFLADHPGYAGTVIDTVMSLNNTTDTLKLSPDKGASWFGEVIYQNTQGGNGDGKSLEKVGSNWQSSSADNGTPGVLTALSPPPAEPAPPPATESTPAPALPASGAAGASPPVAIDPFKIKISELYPNPADKDDPEFIELWNSGSQAVSLEGWKLADSNKVITLTGITLVPGEYRALYATATKVSLNNTKETVSLFDANGTLINSLSYNTTVKGQSLAFSADKKEFAWSALPTPGSLNQITKANDPPIGRISFERNPVALNEAVGISADESSDPDDDPLAFAWSIGSSFQASGQSFTYRFPNLGEQTVQLTVSDGQHTVIATSTITVLAASEIIALRSQAVAIKPVSKNPAISLATSTAELFITELLPNPAGADDNEWIEIFNPNNFMVEVAGWSLDDQEGGSKPYQIPAQNLGPKSYLTLYKKDTKLNLNNAADEVRLFDPTQKLIANVVYKNALDNQSFARDDDEDWSWAIKPTPGKANATASLHSSNPPSAFAKASADKPTPSLDGRGDNNNLVDIDLPNIRELDLGTTVRVQGTVAVPPGVLAKTYFYITGSPGIQVYFSQSDWPKLALGEVVGIIGTLAEANGELRLRVAEKQDIIPLYQGKPPEPLPADTSAIGEETEGNLVKITGELVEKKGSSWLIDDGSGPAKITFQTAAKIKKPAVKAGEWVEVIGLVSEAASGYRVLPRYTSDVRLLSEAEVADKAGAVLGESTAASTSADSIQRFRIPANNESQTILKYLLITSGALIALLAGLLIKFRIETKKRG